MTIRLFPVIADGDGDHVHGVHCNENGGAAWTKEVGLQYGRKQNNGVWCIQAISTARLAGSSSLTSLAM